MIDGVRTLSHLLSALVIVALAASVFEPLPVNALLLRELLLVAPTALIYLALKAHLRRDHSDGIWAAELAALAWALGSSQAVILAHQDLAASAAALLFGCHLLALEGQRRHRARFLVGAGLAGGLAWLAHPPTLLPLMVVALHAVFGGVRHLARPRFDALSGRAMAVLGGLALALGPGLGLFPTTRWPALVGVPAFPLDATFTTPDPARLLDALLGAGSDGLLLQTPWLILALLGLGLWWKRGTRRPLLGVALASLLATIIATALTADAPALALLPALPFLVGPTARLLSSLRERPGRQGPRWAGLGTGLGLAGIAGGPALEFTRSGGTLSLPAIVSVSATLVAVLLLALLLPGRASRRGRLEALGLATSLAFVLALWLSFGRPPLPGDLPSP